MLGIRSATGISSRVIVINSPRSTSELKAAGLRVSIHERSERVLDDRGAGIVLQPETVQLLSERCGLRGEQMGIWLHSRQYLGKDGTPEFH